MTNTEIPKKRKIGALAGGLAFGGLAFCGLNDVDADIVSWTSGVVVANSSLVNFDIDGDGVNDIGAVNYSTTQVLAQVSFNAYFRFSGTVAGLNQLRAFDTGVGTYVVSAGNPNKDYAAYLNNSNVVGSNWTPPITQNFAFEFVNDAGEVNFGWGTLQYNGIGQSFEIVEGYYDNSGSSITVGDTGVTGVPEPSSLMLLGLGAAGLAGFRRKRSA